jgi:hypothetical protein
MQLENFWICHRGLGIFPYIQISCRLTKKQGGGDIRIGLASNVKEASPSRVTKKLKPLSISLAWGHTANGKPIAVENIHRRERDHRIYLEAQMHTIGTKDGRITRTGWGWSEAKVSPFAAAALLPSATNHRAEVGDEEAQPIIPPDLAHKAAQGW